ncbi:hypothetical protein FJ366_01345 [Candidatus Dependentiae bacterium]|nr:hypothetical protein [Candidatus Dependentiae bacterium]
MKTLLKSLLSCSLTVVLLGFSGCTDTKKKSNTNSPKKVTTKKTVKKSVKTDKNDTKVASLYNNADRSFSDSSLEDEGNRLSFIDDQPIELFDQKSFDPSEEDEKLSALSPADQQALEAEVNSLVALWQSEDAENNNQVSVDFKSLFLDDEITKSPAPEQIHTEQKVAENDASETTKSFETEELETLQYLANLEQEEGEEIEASNPTPSTESNLLA